MMMWLARLTRHVTFASKRLGLFFRGLDALMRSRPFFKFGLVFLGNHGMINAMGVIWGPQHPCHYVACALKPVFSVLDATITSVYKSRVSRATASTFKG